MTPVTGTSAGDGSADATPLLRIATQRVLGGTKQSASQFAANGLDFDQAERAALQLAEIVDV